MSEKQDISHTEDAIAERSAAVAKSTASMSAATLLSRITGLARTWVMAFALGNTLLSSAYQVANNMPNVIFDLVAGGLLGAAFIPVYLLQKERRGEAEGNEFACSVLNIVVLVLGILTVLAIIFAGPVVWTQTFTKGADAAVTEYATIFFRIFAAQILFYGISGVINGVLNANRIYFLPALAPALNNIVVIASFIAYIMLEDTDPMLALIVLGVGTTLGVVAQAVIQIPALRNVGFRWKLRINWRDPALIEALKIAVPTVIYIVGTLIAFTFRNAFSLQTGDEGPSTLLYAWMWFQLPYGVIAVSLSRTMFTEMSESAAKEDWGAFRRQVERGISATLLLIVPLAFMMGLFSDSIISLFQAGRFDAQAVAQVSQILTLWSISLPFYSVWMFLYNVFASLRKFGTFAAVSCVLVVVQCVLYALLCRPDVLGLPGVTVADLVYYALGCIVVIVLLRRRIGSFNELTIVGKLVRIVVACAVATVIAFFLKGFLVFGDGGILVGLVQLVIAGLIGLILCFAGCRLLKVPEMQIVTDLIRRFTKRG